MLHKSEAFRRFVKWSVDLSEYDINYKPRSTITVQTLADFIAEVQKQTELFKVANSVWIFLETTEQEQR